MVFAPRLETGILPVEARATSCRAHFARLQTVTDSVSTIEFSACNSSPSIHNPKFLYASCSLTNKRIWHEALDRTRERARGSGVRAQIAVRQGIVQHGKTHAGYGR